MNPPNVPSPYKNFLPSRKFIRALGAIVILALLVFLIPKLISWISSHKSNSLNETSILATVPVGDPIARDTNGIGIPDWELIAAGINPQDPNAITEFEKAKATVGIANFETAASNATDSEKLGLVLYSDLSQDSSVTGSTSSTAVSNVTAAEVTNYISAQQAKNKTYSKSDLTISDDSDAGVKTYYDALIKNTPPTLDKDFITHTTAYIQGKESKDAYLTTKIASLQSFVTKFIATPVPPTATTLQLTAINALSGLTQTLNSYDATNNESLAQLGTVALVEDYYRTIITANANFQAYFSVALTPGPVKK